MEKVCFDACSKHSTNQYGIYVAYFITRSLYIIDEKMNSKLVSLFVNLQDIDKLTANAVIVLYYIVGACYDDYFCRLYIAIQPVSQ